MAAIILIFSSVSFDTMRQIIGERNSDSEGERTPSCSFSRSFSRLGGSAVDKRRAGRHRRHGGRVRRAVVRPHLAGGRYLQVRSGQPFSFSCVPPSISRRGGASKTARHVLGVELLAGTASSLQTLRCCGGVTSERVQRFFVYWDVLPIDAAQHSSAVL